MDLLKPNYLSLLFSLFLFISNSYAQTAEPSFNDGVKAYQIGNFSKAYSIWLPLAENGNVLAQTLLGSLYAYGEGVKRNDEQAAHWFTQAANSGSAQAQYNLGILYEKGWGVKQDNQQARYWYRKAAENGRKDASSRLIMLTDLSDETPVTLPVDENDTTVDDSQLMPFIDIQENPASQADRATGWLRQQAAHQYTLQLAASVDRSLLENNIRGLPLEYEYAIVESVRNNTKWYALVYGSYNNVSEAKQAHSRLPTTLKIWKPWIRPFGDIKTWRVHAGLE